MSSSTNFPNNAVPARHQNDANNGFRPALNAPSFVRAVSGAFGFIRRQSPGMQIGLGAGGGMFPGYVVGKTSKMFAIFVGWSIIFLQFAKWKGYLEFGNDNLGIEAVIGETAEVVVSGGRRNTGKELLKIVSENVRFVYSFIGGFLAGFGEA